MQADSHKMSGSLYQTTWHCIPEDSVLQMFEIIFLITFSMTIPNLSLYITISLYFPLQKTVIHNWNSHFQQSIHSTTLNFLSNCFTFWHYKFNNLESKGQTFHCNNYAPVTEPDSEKNFNIPSVFSGKLGHYQFMDRKWCGPVKNTTG